MALYKVLRNLSTGQMRGEVTRLDWQTPEGVAALINVGAVVLITPLLLAELDGWDDRAAALADAGVGAEDLLFADVQAVAEQVGTDAATIETWRDDLRALLTETHDEGCGCN